MSFLKFLVGVFIFDVCAGSAVMDVRNGLINAPILVMKDELDTPAQTNWTVPGGCLMMQASIHIQVPINSTTFETVKVDPSMAAMVMGNCSLGNNNTQLIGLSWTDKNELNPKAPLQRAINITISANVTSQMYGISWISGMFDVITKNSSTNATMVSSMMYSEMYSPPLIQTPWGKSFSCGSVDNVCVDAPSPTPPPTKTTPHTTKTTPKTTPTTPKTTPTTKKTTPTTPKTTPTTPKTTPTTPKTTPTTSKTTPTTPKTTPTTTKTNPTTTETSPTTPKTSESTAPTAMKDISSNQTTTATTPKTTATTMASTTMAPMMNLTLSFSNLRFDGFRSKNTSINNYQDAIDCNPADKPVNDLIPIIVGAVLAGLVVITLAAYLIGRRYRGQSSTYENVD